jgi:hypothetical protein
MKGAQVALSVFNRTNAGQAGMPALPGGGLSLPGKIWGMIDESRPATG